jgi:IS605 OrfB family transposase
MILYVKGKITVRTYQTRIDSSDQGYALLSEYACLYGKIERTLFAETIAQDIKPETVKNTYLRSFSITARQFNAVCRNLKGKAASIKERRNGLIIESAQRINKAEKVISVLEKKLKSFPNSVDSAKLKLALHQKKRRLHILQIKRSTMVQDKKDNTIRMCFGSKKLFHTQYHLEKNGYANHSEWKKDWKQSRNNQFYVLGSKDETAGCQGCVATKTENSFLLRLRLPEGINSTRKYLKLPISLAYGDDVLEGALTGKQAVSYRFLKDDKGWRVFISTKAISVEKQTSQELGAIGVDINVDHLAVNEIDRSGNPVTAKKINLCTYGKSSHQASAIIGDAVKELMSFSQSKGKPIVVEDLDFKKKKSELERSDKKMARMLSSFSYEKILSCIKARSEDSGIEFIEINPAFTSVIGKFKFAKRYGISTHQAAACAIARRGLKLSERPNRRDYVASFLPVRNRNKHVWSYWGKVSRNKAVHVALSSLASSQSRPPLY